MAKLVGDQGRVIAVDLQQKMLDVLLQRAEKAGLADHIQTHECEQDRLGVDAQADFALAFMMVHEVPDQRRMYGEIYGCLKLDGKLLVAEPKSGRVAGWVGSQSPWPRWSAIPPCALKTNSPPP
jgi:ubiquinone/menaquinone biosynthesis C-methylase UbiE